MLFCISNIEFGSEQMWFWVMRVDTADFLISLCCSAAFLFLWGGGRSLKASPRGISDVTACRLLPGATWPRCNGKQGKGSRFAALSCPAWMQLLLCSPASLHSQRGSSSPTSRLVCTISHTHTHTGSHFVLLKTSLHFERHFSTIQRIIPTWMYAWDWINRLFLHFSLQPLSPLLWYL